MSAIAGFFVFAIVGGVGLGVASADPADELASAGAFGFTASTHETTQESHATRAEESDAPEIDVYERSMLASTSVRTVDSGMKMIDEKERAEQERIAAENAAAIERMQAQKAMQGVVSAPAPEPAADDSGVAEGQSDAAEPEPAVEEEPVMEYNLPAVDWTVGKEAFVEEWSARIDAYLAGSPLSGYGATFAEAAWDNGVDPRWSPAISNTESSKGSVCFLSHNAWGWGSSAWGDWDTAIRAHVAGLASGYGYGLTLDAAQMYCPPHAVDWYNKTLAQMASI